MWEGVMVQCDVGRKVQVARYGIADGSSYVFS